MSIELTVFKGSANAGIVESTTRCDGPTGNEVIVKITHSGIYGTDEHFKHADMVLEHEGVGTVEQIGDRVSQFQISDVVGWGYTHKTCGECEQCLLEVDLDDFDDEEFGINLLEMAEKEDPKDLDWLPPKLQALQMRKKAPEHAAPLMCGGATVFEVIDSYNIRPTDRVGVVGIGGLGHLAIQFLSKMGASVVVFSSTDSKREEALRLGATEFYATNGVESFEMTKLDHLMVTTSFIPDWKPFTDLVIPMMPIVLGGINIQGSVVSSRSAQKKMLNFAARNHITPIVETFPLSKSGIEDGMARLREGKMRYRGVLVAA
ncbi:hypothetical protein DFH08DRAFT_1080007 [Mycena albidolilacea]|uniref:Enoyl reductase (ER) domain-containing protein n=1 Tax=Mycena albidolilacea TaxID=1033008 RepID=A0AAD7ERP8_9AGAR|nr:hypothetical protein DFH08DRAFT_1080007 [Mycena albidolilacea]